MSSKKNVSKKALYSSFTEAKDDQSKFDKHRWFEAVDDYLVATFMVDEILAAVDGRTINGNPAVSIPDIVGHGFYSNLDAEERTAIGNCLVKLIDSGRIKVELPRE